MALKLSDTQTTILNTAMNRPSQDVARDSGVKPQGFAAAMRGLIDKGLVNRVKPKTEIDGSYVMKNDDGQFSFVVNSNAYAALNAEPDPTITVAPPARGTKKIAKAAEPEEGEEGGEKEEVTHSGMMKKKYHDEYMAKGGGNGDMVFEQMKAEFTVEVEEEYETKKGEKRKRTVERVDLPKLRAWGEEIGLWNEAWENGNPGSMRMNLANRVRGAVRKGEHLKLGNRVLRLPEDSK